MSKDQVLDLTLPQFVGYMKPPPDEDGSDPDDGSIYVSDPTPERIAEARRTLREREDELAAAIEALYMRP